MELVVDLDAVTVVLRDVARFGELAVVVSVPPDASGDSDAAVHRLHDVLEASGVGMLDPSGAATVRVEALRFHAAGEVDDDWDRRFSEAWADRLAGEGTLVRAPVRWPSS